VARDDRRLFDLGVPRQRADAQHTGVERDAAQRGEPGNVHQQRRLRQPRVQGGEQRLAAGEHARVVAVLRQQRVCMLRRLGADVVESRRFHRGGMSRWQR
jgi:hypothetical protein